jgi:hypothetical protein
MISAFTEDGIIKNDFDGVSSLFFHKRVRLFVLILMYNCFTHELHMPEVHFFFYLKKNMEILAFRLNAQILV